MTPAKATHFGSTDSCRRWRGVRITNLRIRIDLRSAPWAQLHRQHSQASSAMKPCGNDIRISQIVIVGKRLSENGLDRYKLRPHARSVSLVLARRATRLFRSSCIDHITWFAQCLRRLSRQATRIFQLLPRSNTHPPHPSMGLALLAFLRFHHLWTATVDHSQWLPSRVQLASSTSMSQAGAREAALFCLDLPSRLRTRKKKWTNWTSSTLSRHRPEL